MTNNSEEIELIFRDFKHNLLRHYLIPIQKIVKNNIRLINTTPGFLLNPEQIIIYIGKTHIAVEYLGKELSNKFNKNVSHDFKCLDYSNEEGSLFEKIVGFTYDSTCNESTLDDITHKILLVNFIMKMPIILPTNRGRDKLIELGWHSFFSHSTIFNSTALEPQIGKHLRIVNGQFFDANEYGLKTRHIKWLEFFPISFSETGSISFDISWLSDIAEKDALYSFPIPKDFRAIKLHKINRFIETWGSIKVSETNITSFLSKKENEFILTMKFGAISLYPELTCKWQTEDRPAIRPDFFLLQPNGYADIVEFKLPTVNKRTIIGNSNRETFSAEINYYISQTRVYRDYFDDPNNRKWFEEKYGFKVKKPRRWLVAGRRSDFNSDIWRDIVYDYKDLEIITYDDLIDGVVIQFYK